MTVQEPISHHFTPVFYLKAWARSDGRVIRYYRPNDAVVASPISPKNTGYEEHLYSFEGLPPEVDPGEVLERDFFSPVDSRAAVAHQTLLGGGLNRLTNEQRADWARFMMSTQLRSPFALGELKRLADQNLRANLGSDIEYHAIKKPDDPETIYEWTLKHQPHVIENAHKQFLPKLIDHENLGEYLINMFWATIDVSAASHSLLTADRPFVYTQGWKDPRTVLLFPLSTGILFAATNGSERMAEITRNKPTVLVKDVNHMVASCAVDFVVGADNSHLTFVERRLRRPDQEPIPGVIGKGRQGCPS